MIVMLPALSSISTRNEMRPISEQLDSEFTYVVVDLPGFGSLARPPLAHLQVCRDPHLGRRASTAQARRRARLQEFHPRWCQGADFRHRG